MINCVFSLYVSILKEYIVFFYTLEDLKRNKITHMRTNDK